MAIAAFGEGLACRVLACVRLWRCGCSLSLILCTGRPSTFETKIKNHTSRSGPLVRDRRPPTTRAVELNTKKKETNKGVLQSLGFHRCA